MDDSFAELISSYLWDKAKLAVLFSLLSLIIALLTFIYILILKKKIKKLPSRVDFEQINGGMEGIKLNFTKQLDKFKSELVEETNASKKDHIREMQDLKAHLSNYNKNLFTRNTFILDGLLELNTSYSKWINYLKNIYLPSISAEGKYFEEIKKNCNKYRSDFNATLDNLSVVILDKELIETGKLLRKETQVMERLTMYKLLKLENLKTKYALLNDTDKQSGVLREEERKRLLLEEAEVRKEKKEEIVNQYKTVYHVYTQFSSMLGQQVNKSIQS
ncbi:hypothetical protein [Flexithrix dorotheae]|uniref:hypothetical protein n=1 Tax=Flexithrix dorotheae TaxID=70993 RepID=UPI00037A7D14|nr:hypothetical protein [Flexithrix dorotheae]